MPTPKSSAALALGETPSKSDEDVEAIADALEMAFGKRPDADQVEAFCMAVVLAAEAHASDEY